MRRIKKGDKIWIHDGTFTHCGTVNDVVYKNWKDQTVWGYKINGNAYVFEVHKVFRTLTALKYTLLIRAISALYSDIIKFKTKIIRVIKFS